MGFLYRVTGLSTAGAILFRGKAEEETAAQVFDSLAVIIGTGLGILIGLAIGILLVFILRLSAKKALLLKFLSNRINYPLLFGGISIGAMFGFEYALATVDISKHSWLTHLQHFFIILVIAAFTWLLAKSAYLLEDVASSNRTASTHGKRNRLITQAQILRRILQFIIVLLGLATIILTFPQAQVAMSSILASAGIASIMATLAAQATLANIFAGLQLAFTDAVRVGDVIQVKGIDGQKEYGNIEEITLTYVVVSLYDERRMIIPSTQLTKDCFENWSRRHPQQYGVVMLKLDFGAPVNLIRARVDYLLSKTELWDRRPAHVNIVDADAESITLRIMLSAANADELWALRCYIREELIAWIHQQIPQALVSRRFSPQFGDSSEMMMTLEEQIKNHIAEKELKAHRHPTAINRPKLNVESKDE